MKKVLFTLLFISFFATSAFSKQCTTCEKTNDFYFITKILMTTPQSHEHDGATLESGVGAGFGLDFGYMFAEHFALEVDFSYDNNEVTENSATIGEDAYYLTYAVDVTYSLHVTHALGLMFKVGYELEQEIIKTLHIDLFETGIVYGIGVEYAFTKQYEIVTEYEHSNIESTRGQSYYVGFKYNF